MTPSVAIAPASFGGYAKHNNMQQPPLPAFQPWPCLALAACLSEASGQWSDAMAPDRMEWTRAMEAYENNQFALALHAFDQLADEQDPVSEACAVATYHAAMSSMSLYHKDASYRIESFIARFPESPWALEARWQLANHQYKRRNYKKALEQFLQIRPRELSPERRDELRFKLGHCHFEREQYEEARIQLFDVLELSGPFQAPAQYYFAHVAYINNQPQVALDGFRRLPTSRVLGIGPLVHRTTPSCHRPMQRVENVRHPVGRGEWPEEGSRAEVARLLGDAYYREGNAEDALPHLNMAWDSNQGPEHTPDFAYQVGHTRYQLEQFEEALPCLSVATREDDELAQHAAYRMADCHLQLGDKSRAKQAFKAASQSDFDADIKEDAFFHYAKLSYESSFNPLDDALVAFENYLDAFPSSERRDEAYRFLLEVHMTSRNYERALEALANIEDPDQTVQAAAQVLAFNRAVGCSKTSNLPEHWSSSSVPAPRTSTSAACRNVLLGRRNLVQPRQVPSGRRGRRQVLPTPGSYLSPLHDDANYARGYAHFKSEKHRRAVRVSRLRGSQPRRSSTRRDAELRAADCFYALKSFDQAGDYYDRVLERGVKPLDYALFQRAMSSKFDGDAQGQTTRLDQLLADHPKSRLVVEALYQAAKTHIELEDSVPPRPSSTAFSTNLPPPPCEGRLG